MSEKKSEDHELVISSSKNGVLTITLNGLDNGNALTVSMTEALSEVLESINSKREVHCVLLRSATKHFCTGGNVKDMQAGSDLMDGSVEDVRDRLHRSLHRITRALNSLDVPSVCAINGAAIGAGFDLALMCDIRIAGARAVFAESFLRLGLVSGIGGSWFLSRIVGPAKALEMALTSEFIDAEAAHRYGIVSRVVPDDQLDLETRELAARIAANPPGALRMTKKLWRESTESTLTAALEMAASMQAILLCGREHKNAVTDFLERKQAAREASRN